MLENNICALCTEISHGLYRVKYYGFYAWKAARELHRN